MKRIATVALFIAAILLVGTHVVAVQTAITAQDTVIFSTPSRSSEQIIQIPKDTPLDVLRRKGGWYQVQLNESQKGWLPLLKIRFVSEQEAKDQSIANILRQTSDMPTAAGITSGVRGMRSEKLTIVESEPSQIIETLEHYIPSDEDVSDFAEQGELKTQTEVELIH